MLSTQKQRNSYVYGPVKSWRSGTSLGIDPIGDISTCSFNCAYCQLGKIENITTEVKNYVPTLYIAEDLENIDLDFNELDVITFAGSGEPTLAENLAEMIQAIRDLLAKKKAKVPISILTNATMFNNAEVRKRAMAADLISLKLDAPNDEILRSINQAADGVSLESIISGIKKLKAEIDGATQLQLQLMFMPKYVKQDTYIEDMATIIKELGIDRLQINTPTRTKPVYKDRDYWIETRGNHYAPGSGQEEEVPEGVEFVELPVISKEEAFAIEDKLRSLLGDKELEIINVYRRE